MNEITCARNEPKPKKLFGKKYCVFFFLVVLGVGYNQQLINVMVITKEKPTSWPGAGLG
jgi:hypothetical protein